MRQGRIAHSLVILVLLALAPVAGADSGESSDLWTDLRAHVQETLQALADRVDRVTELTYRVGLEWLSTEGEEEGDDESSAPTFGPNPDPGPVAEVFPQIEPGG